MNNSLAFSRLLMVLTMFVASATLFTACSGEDDPEPQIDGPWTLSTYDYTGTVTTSNNGQTISVATLIISLTSSTAKAVVNSDGSYTTSGSFTLSREFTVDGQTTTSTQTADVSGNGTWTLTDNALTFTDSDGTASNYTLTELTASSLVYTENVSQTRVNGDGNDQKAEGVRTIGYTR